MLVKILDKKSANSINCLFAYHRPHMVQTNTGKVFDQTLIPRCHQDVMNLSSRVHTGHSKVCR